MNATAASLSLNLHIPDILSFVLLFPLFILSLLYLPFSLSLAVILSSSLSLPMKKTKQKTMQEIEGELFNRGGSVPTHQATAVWDVHTNGGNSI